MKWLVGALTVLVLVLLIGQLLMWRLLRPPFRFTATAGVDQEITSTGDLHSTSADAVYSFRRLYTAFPDWNQEWRAIFGQIDGTYGAFELEGKDPASGQHAAFSVSRGYFYSLRPYRWRLGRTRRVTGGSVGSVDGAPGTSDVSGIVFTFEEAKNGTPVFDRVFVIGAKNTRSVTYSVTWSADGTGSNPQTVDVKTGEYLEIDAGGTAQVKAIRDADATIKSLLDRIGALAGKEGVYWNKTW